MAAFTQIKFGDNLTVTDEGGGVIRVDGAPVAATPSPDATTSVKGLLQLAGDLAGTAASPQIAAGVVVNADVAAAAAIAGSKLGLNIASVPPSSPSNGDLWLYQSSPNSWLFYYDSTEPTYKWKLIGGAPFLAEVTATENLTSTTYAALATTGPSVNLPRAGDYLVAIGADMRCGTASADVRMSYDIGATAAVDADSVLDANVTANVFLPLQRERYKAGLSTVTLTAKYRSTAGTAVFQSRWMRILPVRVI